MSPMIEEIKATLAMEGLVLTAREEQLLTEYCNGQATFDQIMELVLNALKSRQAA